MKLKLVAVGGTFDRLHRGHKKLILKAFEVGDEVIIGLTTDSMVKNKFLGKEILSFDERLKELKEFLEDEGLLSRCKILPLNDVYGPTIIDESIEGLVVSEETLGRALEINRIRVSNGMRPLIIFVIPLLLAENGKPISSHRIRSGEINRNGKVLRKTSQRQIYKQIST
ncbi:MAG: phosphopantetheine adenylyltransferase [Candidatus Baldrarchaeia archaeon]